MGKSKEEKDDWNDLLAVFNEEESVPDMETQELAENIRSLMQAALDLNLEDVENNDSELLNVLLDDDYLLEELVDKLALVSMTEQLDGGEITAEAREKVYLAFLDTYFELSKTLNSLGGFAKGRLQAALDLLDDFENRFFPLTTKIDADNAEAFKELITDEFYDDILVGRKRAIGALRHIGEDMYAAGAIVYSVYTSENLEAPLIRIHWINVSEDLRGQGIGNMLMGRVIGLALQNEGSAVTVNLPVYNDGTEENEKQEILKNLMVSWNFAFELSVGERFAVRIADLKKNEYIDNPDSDAISLYDLGGKGPELLNEYFKKNKKIIDKEVSSLPYEFFDPYVSCVILSEGKISSVLLLHRYTKGDYRYELLRCKGGFDSPDVEKLFRYAYRMAEDLGDHNGTLFGTFESEEGYETITEILPFSHLSMVYSGLLKPPSYDMSNEEWDELRKEAGLSDEKLPGDEDALDDETMTDEELHKMIKLLGGN